MAAFDDLPEVRIGDLGVEEVLYSLRTFYNCPKAYHRKGYIKTHDIVIPERDNETWEIKKEMYKTGNMAVEMENTNTNEYSGIMVCKAEFFIDIVMGEKLMFYTAKLRTSCIIARKYEIYPYIHTWHGTGNSRCLLVPIEKIKQSSCYKGKLK